MKTLLLLLLLVPVVSLCPYAVPCSNLVLPQLEFFYLQVTGTVQGTHLEGRYELEVRNIRDTVAGSFRPAPEAAWIVFLPPGSAVHGLSLLMDRQWIAGSLVNRTRASDTYDTIVSTARANSLGRDPGLLEEIGPDVYRLQVFPVTNTLRIRIHWYAPLEIRNGHCRLHLNPHLSGRIRDMAAGVFRWSTSVYSTVQQKTWWPKNLCAIVSITNGNRLAFQEGYALQDLPAMLEWRQQEPLRRVPSPAAHRMLAEKRTWMRQWESFRTDRSRTWETLAGKVTTFPFVGPGRSLIALEPGMSLQPERRRGTLALPTLGRPGAADGFGGFNGQLLDKQTLDTILRLRGPYYRKILAFYEELESRNPARITAALLNNKLFDPELGPRTLDHFCTTANLTRRELDIHRAFLPPSVPRSTGFDFDREREEILKIVKGKAVQNPLYPLYKLLVLCDFARKCNLYRYGVTPWELFLHL